MRQIKIRVGWMRKTEGKHVAFTKKEFLLGISIVFMLTLICVMEPIIVCSEDIQPDSSISDSSFPTKKGKEQVVNSDNNQNEISDSNNNKTISGSKEETDPTSESINKVEGKQNSENRIVVNLCLQTIARVLKIQKKILV